MAACWRALHLLPEIDVFVIAFQARTQTAFSDQLMQGIPCRLLNHQERQDANLVKSVVLAESADVVILSGCFTNPIVIWLLHLNSLRQPDYGYGYPLVGYVETTPNPMDTAFIFATHGSRCCQRERSWQYASHLGSFTCKNCAWAIRYRLQCLVPALGTTVTYSWPRSFLFVGRYVSAKAIDLLAEAYQLYRSQVSDPWKLVCCGQGPLSSQLQGQPGLKIAAFYNQQKCKKFGRLLGHFSAKPI
jgi:hypothetical protein